MRASSYLVVFLLFSFSDLVSAERPKGPDGTKPATVDMADSLAEVPKSLELVTTHTHTIQNLPLSISSPLLRIDTFTQK